MQLIRLIPLTCRRHWLCSVFDISVSQLPTEIIYATYSTNLPASDSFNPLFQLYNHLSSNQYSCTSIPSRMQGTFVSINSSYEKFQSKQYDHLIRTKFGKNYLQFGIEKKANFIFEYSKRTLSYPPSPVHLPPTKTQAISFSRMIERTWQAGKSNFDKIFYCFLYFYD